MVLRFATLPMLIFTLTVGAAVPAHAGMMEWVDNIFTFREDQKERVSPRRNLPPKVVVSPHYDQADHAAWSGYYTRTDLRPEPYIAGSGSKVMRPLPQTNHQGQQDRGFGSSRSHTYIGDPGTGPAMVLGGSANLGGDTRIAPAVRDWREGAPDDPFGGRPGDYNYRLHADNRGYDTRGDCCPTQGSSRSYDDPNRAAEGPYIRFNNQGQVTGYNVQRGDTLSTIADQPRIYQNWKLWPLIYSANRGVIGRDPDNLHPKQNLDIPRDYTTTQQRDAEKRALRRGPGVYGDGK